MGILLLSTCASAPLPSEGAERFELGASERRGLLFLAHGAGNSAEDWPRRFIERLRESEYALEGWQLEAYDWEATARFSPAAGRRGYEVGSELGRRYAAGSYEVIHLVGHSIGAHLIQGFVDAYREAGGSAYVQMTFLDPFSPRSIFSWRWGQKHFGRGADYAESYVVRGEAVIGTNRFLARAHNWDITALVPTEYREKSWSSPHWWPVRFYRESVDRYGPGFAASPLARSVEQDEVWTVSYRAFATQPERGEVTVLR